MEKLYTCKEIAERYGVKINTVWTWIRQKKLGAVCVGTRNYRIRENDLTEFEKNK